jgi:hypothetical protein
MQAGSQLGKEEGAMAKKKKKKTQSNGPLH